MGTATLQATPEIVRVVNREQYPLTVKWDSHKYALPPGQEVFIPGACAYSWFGDPRSTNVFQSLTGEHGTTAFVVDRATEVRRLRIKYGAGLEGDEATFDGVAIPSVEVYTVDGERITTVLDDPNGDTVIQSSTSVREDEDLRAVVARQARELAAMREHLGMEDELHEAVMNENQLPLDDTASTYEREVEVN